MRDRRLLDYYERELTFLREMGDDFARRYPAVASRLRLEGSRADDPHVERLLEGFAFLAARVHLKIDDDFPEISQALLNIAYPHYLRPVPSMSLAEFRLDTEQAMLTSGWTIPRGAPLVTAPTTAGTRCRFRTCYETEIWPIAVRDAGWHSPHEVKSPFPTDAAAVLRIDLETVGQIPFGELELSRLRFYLDGDPGLVGNLYELLLNDCHQVVAWEPGADNPAATVTRLGRALRPVGFEVDEGMLPAEGRSYLGHRLVQEYFTFPQKYHFLDLTGLDALRGSEAGSSLQILCIVSHFQRRERHARLQEGVSQRTLRLGCSPIVNLFSTEATPIILDQRRVEYPLGVRGDAEVVSVEDVYAVEPGTTERIRFAPFHALRHGMRDSARGTYWYLRREPRTFREDSLTDVRIALVDLEGRTAHPDHHSVSARVLCSNGNLPNELPIGTGAPDFFLEEDSAPLVGIFALTAPTPSIPPPLDQPIRKSRPRAEAGEDDPPMKPAHGGRQLWRLVSLLSLNQLSLVDHGEMPFREALRLQNLGDSPLGERHIEGIVGVRSSPSRAPVHGEHGLSFARGRNVEITLDEHQFTGGGVYLFASVLERFLAQYASLNSFVRVEARTRQRPEPLKVWPPRAGVRPLL